MTTPLRPQREPNNSIFKTKPLSPAVQHTAFYQTLLSDMQNSYQVRKVHQFSQGNSSCREKKNPHLQTLKRCQSCKGTRGIYGYRYIHIRKHYSEQVPCTQHTHTSGYRARESSTELPTTEDGKFQHGDTSMLQLQCRNHPKDGNFQEGTRSRLNPKWKRHNSRIQLSNSNGSNPASYQKMYLNNKCTLPG